MVTVINADTILDQIKRAVNVAGAATHRQCYYALYMDPSDPEGAPVDYDTANMRLRVDYGTDGKPVPVEPHCIVGTVLNNLGVPLTSFEQVEGIYVSRRMWRIADEANVHIDVEGWEALYAAQATQDDGCDWGQAQKSAESIVQRIREADAEGCDSNGDYVYRQFTE